jgi:nitrogen fixation protein FixH
MSSKKSSGKIWPYIIGISITLVFGFCVATVVVTSKADIQSSDVYMTNYQDADAKANELIKAQIAFDKKYNLAYTTKTIAGENPVVAYTLQDKEGNPINSAEIIVQISRPETSKFDQKLQNPEVRDGVYRFRDASFPKEGVWNIIAKVKVGEDYKFYNIKADTRNDNAYEF